MYTISVSQPGPPQQNVIDWVAYNQHLFFHSLETEVQGQVSVWLVFSEDSPLIAGSNVLCPCMAERACSSSF